MYGSFLGGLAAVAMLVFFQLCGICVSCQVFREESSGVRLLIGSVIGSVSLQWFPALAAFVFGFTIPAHLIAVALAAAAAAGSLLVSKRRGRDTGLSLGVLKEGAAAFSRHKFLFFVLAVLALFCYLVLHSFRTQDGRVYSSQATYGDMSMHLSFITSLTRQGTFPPFYSILPDTQLSYPFLCDSVSASLYLLGAPLRLSYCLPMFLAGGQVLFGGWLLLRELCGHDGKARGALAFVLFFFNGGLGVFWFLGGEPGNFSRIFTEFYQTPTNLSSENICWVNVIVDMMLPQRATLFGWALLFTTLWLLYRAVFCGQSRYFPVVGIFAGAMPMIHTHSFLALALVCGTWLTVSLCKGERLSTVMVRAGKLLIPAGLVFMSVLQVFLQKNQAIDSPKLLLFACGGIGLWGLFLLWRIWTELRAGRRAELLSTWGLLLGITLVLALPQLFTWTFRQVGGGEMLRGHFGWKVTELGKDGYLWFYLKNIGLTAVLAVVGLLLSNKEGFQKYCPAMAIWFLAEFVEFQPNNYDNNKLLYVGFLFICCAAAEGLFRLLDYIKGMTPQRAAAAAAAAGAVLSVSAVLTMGREAVASYELFGRGALELVKYVEDNLEPDAVVLTNQRHNNEIASLSGRNLVCGAPTFLYFHGLDYYDREKACRQMYQQPVLNKELFDKYQVDYVLVSDFEESDFQPDNQALAGLFPRVYDDGVRALYKVERGDGANG